MKMQSCVRIFYAFLGLCTAVSCREDINIPAGQMKPEGIYIVNEGNYLASTGDISFFDPDSMKVVNNLFLGANGAPAGDVVQDMLVHDTLGIIAVNNSNKVRIVNIRTFKLIRDIPVTLPRRIAMAGASKAYISCWDGHVRILDLNTLTVTGSVPVPESYPEGILVAGGLAFVSLSAGFDWGVQPGQHRELAVISAAADTLTARIPVGYNPQKMALYEDWDRIYVACGGSEFTAPKAHGGIYIVDVRQLRTVDSIITQPGETAPDTLYPSGIRIDSRYCYFINHFSGPVTVFNMQTLYITGKIPGDHYGLAVDPYHGLILTTTPSADGKLKVYNPSLELLVELSVGEYPSTIVFRYREN